MNGDEAEHLAWVASCESGLVERGRCDPRLMAVNYCELQLAPWPRARPRLSSGVIWYPSGQPEDAEAFLVGHEVAHDLLNAAGVNLVGDPLERACSRIAAALLLPRPAFRRDLASVGWDVLALHELWPLASPWIIARRITEVAVGGAVASRWRAGRVERVGSEDAALPDAPTSTERSLARRAKGQQVVDGDRLRAWPSDSGAIVVCGLEELRGRTVSTRPMRAARRSERR